MANNTRKISELSSKGIVPESALLPVAVASVEKETYRTTLNNLRANLLFENAYETLAEGIAATVKDEIFYVYTDDSQFYVAAFTNVNGASATALYKDNTPVIYGTGKMMADGKFGFSQWKLKSAIEAKGADEARVHFGIVAQDIKEAFELAGLDATKYGILIYDSWDDQEEILDEAGSVVQEAREAGDIWMVRMEECLALEAAYVRREMEKQRQQLQSLMDALGHS